VESFRFKEQLLPHGVDNIICTLNGILAILEGSNCNELTCVGEAKVFAEEDYDEVVFAEVGFVSKKGKQYYIAYGTREWFWIGPGYNYVTGGDYSFQLKVCLTGPFFILHHVMPV
jgi:hypothetical protein